jgi:hypothetical protein
VRIDGTPVCFIDYETELIAPGYILPRPAIATTYLAPDDAAELGWSAFSGAQLWLTHQLDGLWRFLLEQAIAGRCYIGGHDAARFECNVTGAHYPHLRRLLKQALDADRIVDTIQAERIIEIHRHTRAGAGLDDLCRKYGHPFVDKSDPETQALRLSFGQFIGALEIPAAHAEYALHDAVAPAVVLERQWSTQLVDVHDLGEFCRRAYNGGRVSARGFRTAPERVERLAEMVDAKLRDLETIAREYGFLRSNRDGTVSKNKKAIQIAVACDYAGQDKPVYTAADLKSKAALARAQKAWVESIQNHPAVPKTDASDTYPNGQIKTDRLTLEDATDPKLQTLAEWDQLLYIRNKDLAIFRNGAVAPVHTRFTIVDTTRYGSSAPQVHNFGKAAGVRECIAARPGYALVVSDFKMLELVALAQLCADTLGLHTMAQKIRDGVDMHAEIGADVLECTYEEIQARRKASDYAADEARDSGKPANFGLNGGMTDVDTYILYARKSYGQLLCAQMPGESNAAVHERRRAKAERIIAAWRQRAVDQQAWIEHVRRGGYRLGDRGMRYDMKHPGFRNLFRRGLSRTEATNNPFQIVGANVSHRAVGYVLDAQYVPADDGGPGALAGSHMVLTTHDDIVSEVPLHCVGVHASVQEELMARAAREICPGVFFADTPTKRIVDTRVLTHLSKSAPATRAADGTLTVTNVAMPAALK